MSYICNIGSLHKYHDLICFSISKAARKVAQPQQNHLYHFNNCVLCGIGRPNLASLNVICVLFLIDWGTGRSFFKLISERHYWVKHTAKTSVHVWHRHVEDCVEISLYFAGACIFHVKQPFNPLVTASELRKKTHFSPFPLLLTGFRLISVRMAKNEFLQFSD